MTTGKTIALTRQILIGKVMSLLLNMLSRLVITFLPRSNPTLKTNKKTPEILGRNIEAIKIPTGNFIIEKIHTAGPHRDSVTKLRLRTVVLI